MLALESSDLNCKIQAARYFESKVCLMSPEVTDSPESLRGHHVPLALKNFLRQGVITLIFRASSIRQCCCIRKAAKSPRLNPNTLILLP